MIPPQNKSLTPPFIVNDEAHLCNKCTPTLFFIEMQKDIYDSHTHTHVPSFKPYTFRFWNIIFTNRVAIIVYLIFNFTYEYIVKNL